MQLGGSVRTSQRKQFLLQYVAELTDTWPEDVMMEKSFPWRLNEFKKRRFTGD